MVPAVTRKRFFLFLGVAGSLLLLASLPALSKESDRPWEELSRQAAGKGDYRLALDYLHRAEISKPANPVLGRKKFALLYQLGQQLYQENKFGEAEDVFLQARDLQPDSQPVLKALGYISYYSQRLELAREYWEKALLLNPQDSELSARLQHLENELKIEDKLDFSHLSNFAFRFHADNAEYNIYDIQSHLLQAHREIGYDFNYYPTRTLPVILYTRQEFECLRSTPQWVGGLYDGKIRIPVEAGDLRAIDFKKILWHEYTHALIHDLTLNNCPRWFHEGLAQYQESKVEAIDLEPLRRARETESLISLVRLNEELSFGNNPQRVKLAYAQAYSFTDYLVTSYGFWRINLILERLKKGENWKNALENEILTPLESLEQDWHRSLEVKFGG